MIFNSNLIKNLIFQYDPLYLSKSHMRPASYLEFETPALGH